MTSKARFLKAAAGWAAVAIVGAIGVSQPAGAAAKCVGEKCPPCCAAMKTDWVKSKTGALALSKAIAVWEGMARARCGPPYASWASAREKSKTCRTYGAADHRCVVRAKPCRA